MTIFEEESAFLRASAQELQDYLLSPQLFWRLTPNRCDRKVSLLQLTPGNLLLCLAILEALCQDRLDCTEVMALRGQVAQLRERWKTHWLQKVRLEYRNRLDAWQDYLREGKATRLEASGYTFKVRLRVILCLLELEDPPQSRQVLDSLDKTLEDLTSPSEFIWEPGLAKAFPSHVFWFLSRLPRK